jgi:hypothetical protein
MGYLNFQLEKVASAIDKDKKSFLEQYVDGLVTAAPGALIGIGGLTTGGLAGRYALQSIIDKTALKGKLSPSAFGRLILSESGRTGPGNVLKKLWKHAPGKGKAALVASPLLALGGMGAGLVHTWNAARELEDK